MTGRIMPSLQGRMSLIYFNVKINQIITTPIISTPFYESRYIWAFLAIMVWILFY